MKKFLLVLFLLVGVSSPNILATVFSEFFVNPNAAAGATNVNAGSTSTGTALYTSTATVAGGWDGTSVFTPDDGSTPASTVSAGMFASVFTNGVNTNAVYVGRITAVAAGVNGGITISTVAKSGTAPGLCLGATAAITIKVGGTWKGPHVTSGPSITFPFNFAGPNLTNTDGAMTCVNFIGGTNYNVTNAITHAVNGPMRWEGYTNAPHDGGFARINGGTVVSAYILLTASCQRNDFVGLEFINNGGSLNTDGVVVSGSGNLFHRCVFGAMRRDGVLTTAVGIFSECESYSNNVANITGRGGFDNQGAGNVYIRCVSHDNTNSNTSGWSFSQSAILIECISLRNGANGFSYSTIGDPLVMKNCDAYWNAGAGLDMVGTVPSVAQLVYLENCNFVTNGTFGINSSTAATQFKRNGAFFNNGFGSGTRTNSSGNMGINLTNVYQIGTVQYASDVTPWVAPDTGDFRINLGAAQNTGRGAFLQTAVGLTNNLVGFPDIGAVQHLPVTNTPPTSTFISF